MDIVTITYHSTNYYALDIKGGKLLVDCGWPGTFSQFAAELKRKGILPDEIKFILVTHFHPDHAGLVQEFKDLGARLILMETQVGYVSQLKNLTKTDKVPYKDIREDDNFNLPFKESRNFLASLGLAGEILETPGHSPDSITLVLDEGYAFTGDLHPPELATEDQFELVFKSWDKIRAHKIVRIYPGHGN